MHKVTYGPEVIYGATTMMLGRPAASQRPDSISQQLSPHHY